MARGLGVKQSSPFARVAMFVACIIVGIVVFVFSPGGGSEPIELYLVEAAARGRSAARRVIRKYSEAAQIDGELPEIGGDALKLKPAGRIVSIGAAHTRGLLHRGVWIFVLDPQQHVLVMKRSAATVTCPGAFSLVGEHSAPREAWDATARRGLREELGIAVEPASLAQLGAPVLFRTDYKREGGLRAGYGEKQDAQATAFFVAFVDNATASQLRPDSEVADYRWKELHELDADARAAARGTLGFATAFCNEPIRRLLVLGLKRLRARLESRP